MPAPATDPYDPASRVTLAPGLRVVRRGVDRWQVGLDPSRRALLPRDRTTGSVLRALELGTPLPTSTAARRVVHALLDAGCLAVGPGRVPPELEVALLDDLLSDRADDLLDPARLVPGPGLRLTPWTDTADVVLVRTRGECDRDRLDPLVRAGTPHLLLRLVDGDAVLGPFVVPGLTACLRCLDAHRAVHDPDHHVVTARYVRAGAARRTDGVPDLPDPALVALVTATAVRELAAYARGEEPASWSRTRRWSGDGAEPVEHAWARHPGCGCSWAPTSAPGDQACGTMGA